MMAAAPAKRSPRKSETSQTYPKSRFEVQRDPTSTSSSPSISGGGVSSFHDSLPTERGSHGKRDNLATPAARRTSPRRNTANLTDEKLKTTEPNGLFGQLDTTVLLDDETRSQLFLFDPTTMLGDTRLFPDIGDLDLYTIGNLNPGKDPQGARRSPRKKLHGDFSARDILEDPVPFGIDPTFGVLSNSSSGDGSVRLGTDEISGLNSPAGPKSLVNSSQMTHMVISPSSLPGRTHSRDSTLQNDLQQSQGREERKKKSSQSIKSDKQSKDSIKQEKRLVLKIASPSLSAAAKEAPMEIKNPKPIKIKLKTLGSVLKLYPSNNEDTELKSMSKLDVNKVQIENAVKANDSKSTENNAGKVYSWKPEGLNKDIKNSPGPSLRNSASSLFCGKNLPNKGQSAHEGNAVENPAHSPNLVKPKINESSTDDGEETSPVNKPEVDDGKAPEAPRKRKPKRQVWAWVPVIPQTAEVIDVNAPRARRIRRFSDPSVRHQQDRPAPIEKDKLSSSNKRMKLTETSGVEEVVRANMNSDIVMDVESKAIQVSSKGDDMLVDNVSTSSVKSLDTASSSSEQIPPYKRKDWCQTCKEKLPQLNCSTCRFSFHFSCVEEGFDKPFEGADTWRCNKCSFREKKRSGALDLENGSRADSVVGNHQVASGLMAIRYQIMKATPQLFSLPNELKVRSKKPLRESASKLTVPVQAAEKLDDREDKTTNESKLKIRVSAKSYSVAAALDQPEKHPEPGTIPSNTRYRISESRILDDFKRKCSTLVGPTDGHQAYGIHVMSYERYQKLVKFEKESKPIIRDVC